MGYGDIYPISDIGRVVSMISALVGIAIIALPSGIITAGYMEETNERKRKRLTRKDLKRMVSCNFKSSIIMAFRKRKT